MGTHLGGGLLWPAGSRNLDRAKARMCKARRVLPSTRAVLVGATPTLSRSDSSSGGGCLPNQHLELVRTRSRQRTSSVGQQVVARVSAWKK
jgi:hypothetical protein